MKNCRTPRASSKLQNGCPYSFTTAIVGEQAIDKRTAKKVDKKKSGHTCSCLCHCHRATTDKTCFDKAKEDTAGDENDKNVEKETTQQGEGDFGRPGHEQDSFVHRRPSILRSVSSTSVNSRPTASSKAKELLAGQREVDSMLLTKGIRRRADAGCDAEVQHQIDHDMNHSARAKEVEAFQNPLYTCVDTADDLLARIRLERRQMRREAFAEERWDFLEYLTDFAVDEAAGDSSNSKMTQIKQSI